MKKYTLTQFKKAYSQNLGFLMLLIVTCSFGGNVKADDQPRGAQMPYIRYESEAAEIGNGAELLGPTYDQSLIASEASNRQCVQLTTTGAYIKWVITEEAQGMVLRFSIPDSSIGGGIKRNLTMYINSSDTIVLTLYSKFAWQYFNSNNEPSNNPAVGGARMRFDELRLILPDTLSIGDTITIQKEISDIADYYAIDFIELEAIPDAIVSPVGYLNVTEAPYNATPDDGTNDIGAFNSAITAARLAGKGVYVPQGRFNLGGTLNLADNAILQGAGIWYTELYFTSAFGGGINGDGTDLHISDLYLTCENRSRQDFKSLKGYWGIGSTISNIWSVHFECGAWIADYTELIHVTDALVISNCRFRNTYADGCNLAKGTKNTIVENCSFRNNGDDAMASWSSDETVVEPCTRNTFRYNTVENNYRAGGLGLFGGTGHSAHHCIIKDMLNDGGIRITSIFPGHTFSSAEYFDIHDMTLIRTGPTTEWDNIEGAINLQTRNSAVHHLKFENIDIVDAVHHGIFIKGESSYKLTEIYFDSISINGAGGYGIYVENGTQGWASKGDITFNSVADGEIFDNAPFIFREKGTEILTVTTSTGGTVTLNPLGGSYSTGTEVTLTAIPSEGYEFNNWTGDITSSANPLQITMDTYKSVMANFSEVSAIRKVNVQLNKPTIAPNPTEGFVDIQFNSAKINSIVVFDCTGKKIKSELTTFNSTHYLLDLGDLQRGIYFISLLTTEKSLIYKVVKK